MRNPLGLPVFLSLFAVWSTACRSLAGHADEAAEAQAAAKAKDTAPVSGHYVGYAKPDQVSARLAAVLDLVRLNELAGLVHYRAILRLSAGGQTGAEYGSAYLPDVTYARASRSFNWGSSASGLTLTKVQAGEGGFSGTFTSESDKASADFSVRLADGKGAGSDQSLPLLSSPTGSYSGSCPDHVSGLQIEASRWRQASAGLFGNVLLTGRLLQADAGRCLNDQPCLKKVYTSGSYQPLTGSLELGSGADKLACKIQKEQLVCGDCTLTFDPISSYGLLAQANTSDELHERKQHITPVTPVSDKPPTHLPDSYYGYLHHEQTDTYQLIALNVQVERALQAAAAGPVAANLQLSGVASAYFGEGDSSELVAYRFQPVAWGGQGPFVLDGDGEVFIVVETWDDGKMVGTWYSKTRGRIGTVELQPKLVPVLAAGLKSMQRLSHSYKGGDWDFDLAATANLSEHADDFYPLKINGWAKDKKGEQARRRTVKEGTYDFYTGRVALRLDDGRMAIGRVDADGLQIYWPGKPRQGAPLSAGTQVFKPTAGS